MAKDLATEAQVMLTARFARDTAVKEFGNAEARLRQVEKDYAEACRVFSKEAQAQVRGGMLVVDLSPSGPAFVIQYEKDGAFQVTESKVVKAGGR